MGATQLSGKLRVTCLRAGGITGVRNINAYQFLPFRVPCQGPISVHFAFPVIYPVPHRSTTLGILDFANGAHCNSVDRSVRLFPHGL